MNLSNLRPSLSDRLRSRSGGPVPSYGSVLPMPHQYQTSSQRKPFPAEVIPHRKNMKMNIRDLVPPDPMIDRNMPQSTPWRGREIVASTTATPVEPKVVPPYVTLAEELEDIGAEIEDSPAYETEFYEPPLAEEGTPSPDSEPVQPLREFPYLRPGLTPEMFREIQEEAWREQLRQKMLQMRLG